MTDATEQRAARVKAIVEGNFGRVAFRSGDKMVVDVPADLAMGLPWGSAGFVPVFIGQSVELAPRRVTDMNYRTVVCEGDLVTTAFYRYEIDLKPVSAPVANTHDGVAAITRQVP
jgi:hypothetical protein